jgi:hypothetical protein
MSILNDVVHFRGETVTLYATFKLITGESAQFDLDFVSPTIHIEYATPNNQIVIILPPTSMTRMTNDRYFYNWIVPNNAPMTTYNIVYSGIIDDKKVVSTEDLIVGNPALTVKQNFLRYGPSTFLLMSRVYEPRLSPQLPRGTF